MKYAFAFILFFFAGNYSFEKKGESNNVEQIEHKLDRFNQRVTQLNHKINETIISDNK